MLGSLLDNLFAFDEPETPGRRLFFRAFELLIVIECAFLGWAWAAYITRLDDGIHPLGLANYLDLSLLFEGGAAYVAAAILTGLLAAGFLARRVRWSYATAMVLLHILYVARYSLGKVGHGTNLIGMCLLSLALASLFYEDADARRVVALGLARFSVGFSYVLAAVSKLVGTGIDWPSGSHLAMWMTEKSVDVLATTGHYIPNVLQSFLFDHLGWATIMLTFGLLAEASGWLFWYRSTRPYVALALISLHVGIALTMNIRFDLNIFVLLLLGIPWAHLSDRKAAFHSSKTLSSPQT